MTVTWLIVLAAIVLVVIVAALVRKDDPFQAAATELGIKLTRTVPDLLPNLDGLVDGIAVKLDVAGSREPAIRYEVFYPALGMSLKLERETTITRTLGQLGSSDPQVGSKPFDDSFRVNTSRPDALKTMMTPERRRRLIQLIEQYPNVVIADGSITLMSDSLEPPTETIVAITRDLVSAAKTLVEGRPPPLVTPEPRTVQQASPKTSPTAPAAPTADKVQASPGQDGVPTAPPIQKRASAPPSPPQQPSTGLPPEFFDDVFGANRLSFEDEGRFEEEFQGKTVTLSGPVKQASPYAGNDDVAPYAGTKAVITVAQIDNDLYGKTDIDAVVYLVEASDLARGDNVAFRGNLEKVDPFMRNLFITKASLTS